MPAAALANHGAATISTNVSTTSLRQTNELHSGCSPGRIRPTITHLATVVVAAAISPAARMTAPDDAAAAGAPNRAATAASAARTPTAMAAEQASGTNRQSSTVARANRSRRGGLNVRCSSPATTERRRRTGGLPIHELPALDFLGAADMTATSPFLGTARPPAAMPELPRNARRPTLAGATRIHPPPSS